MEYLSCMAVVWAWRNELTTMLLWCGYMTWFLVCGDVLDTNQFTNAWVQAAFLYARLGVFPAKVLLLFLFQPLYSFSYFDSSYQRIEKMLAHVADREISDSVFSVHWICSFTKNIRWLGQCHDGRRVSRHGMGGIGVLQEYWSMGCQEQNWSG